VRPLDGTRIVVTRPRAQASDFSHALEELGAEVVDFPTIRIVDPSDPEPLRRAVAWWDSLDWIVFTSGYRVERFWSELRAGGADTRALSGVSLCAIGPATAAAIDLEGARADLMPPEYVSEAVARALAEKADLRGARVLLPRAEIARSALPELLRERGAEVVEVAAYGTELDGAGAGEVERRLRQNEIDVVTFTSSSTVRNFVALVGADVGRALVASIGPITSATARELGLDVAIEASAYTIPGLTGAIVARLGQ
jgi:uroporphyrinogen III methyltransferase/synthase